MAYPLVQNGDGMEVMLRNVWNSNFDKEVDDELEIPEARDRTDNTSENSFGNRTNYKHKSSQLRFLTWVAYVRKESRKIDETERRTCPLIDCEESPFETTDAMLKHVYTCPRLAKGSYKCCDCGKFERISRIHTNGCHEIHRFSTVTNSLRRAKRLLSSHSPKNRSGGESSMKRQATPESMAELPTPAEPHYHRHSDPFGFASEQDTLWIPEIHGFEIPAEFAAYDNYLPYGRVVSQNSCSELSASHDSTHVSGHQPYRAHVPVELSSDYDSTWMTAENGRQQNSRPFQSLADNISERTHGDPQHLLQDQFDSAGHRYTSYDGASFSKVQSPVSPISDHDYPTCLSLSNSASRTNTEVSALSFGSFYPSRDTSMSSISSFGSQPEHYGKPPSRFFAEEEANLMFSEPESMGESAEPVELPTPVNAHPLNWFGEESSLVFSEPESMEEPAELVEPAELPTSSHASSLTYFEEGPNLIFSIQELMGDSIQPVELPTSSNTYSSHFNLPSSIPKSLPIQREFSEATRSRAIEPRIHPKTSPRPSKPPYGPSPPPLPGVGEGVSKYKCSCGFEPSGKELYKASNL